MINRINGRYTLLVLAVIAIISIYYISSTRENLVQTIKTTPPTSNQLKDTVDKLHDKVPDLITPTSTTNTTRANACFVILIRNSDLKDWRKSMRQLEDRFNRNYNYPYVFLNDVPFTEDFKLYTQSLTKATIEFATIPKEHWSIPDYIDKEKAKSKWEQMKKDNVIYGGSESYRHMCRFESGFFFQQEITKKYDYYWRVEPGVEFACDIDFDPFLYLKENNMKYGFTQSLHEYQTTIPTLWETVKRWSKERGLWGKFPKDNALEWISNDSGETYNGCHFWSNFEIASFDLWRDPQYLDFFNYLDKAGGFFYERWGDAPIHAIYAALTLPRHQIHFFNEIGYYHGPFWHCPVQKELQLKCHCDPAENHDLNSYSCNRQWFDLNQIPYVKP